MMSAMWLKSFGLPWWEMEYILNETRSYFKMPDPSVLCCLEKRYFVFYFTCLLEYKVALIVEITTEETYTFSHHNCPYQGIFMTTWYNELPGARLFARPVELGQL